MFEKTYRYNGSIKLDVYITVAAEDHLEAEERMQEAFNQWFNWAERLNINIENVDEKLDIENIDDPESDPMRYLPAGYWEETH